VRFAKGADWYRVEALGVTETGEWSAAEPPPPPPPDDQTAWGYIPPVPAGWTLIENTTLNVPAGASKLYFRNCKGRVWLKDQSDIIFVDCDMRGSTFGTQGERISAYRCWFGDRVDEDAAQIKPATSGGKRPSGWVLQGCTFINVTRTGTKHTDGIQFGGIDGAVVRHCWFDNISVEMILCNGWNGNPENVLIESCYFGSRTQPGGPPVHFSDAGTYGAKNCKAVDNYYDGTVASIEDPNAGNSQTGTKPRSAWPHGHPTRQNPGLLGY
jgi:hypothetical protein